MIVPRNQNSDPVKILRLNDAVGATPAAGASVPVLVVANGPLVLHHGTLGIIRTLGRMGVPMYCVVKDRFTPAAVSRYLTGAFVWETPGLNSERFLAGMKIIRSHLPSRPIVIPTDDLSAILMAENSAALQPLFLFPQQPHELPRVLANKKELYSLCREKHVPFPNTILPRSLTELAEFARNTAFPVVVKAAESWLLAAGARTTTIARTAEELYAIYLASNRPGVTNMIVQEYIAPAYGEDWFYHGYRNAQSGCCVGFTGKKLRSYPPFAGPTTLGRAIVNESLRGYAEALLEMIGYSGIVDLDYRLDKRDGQYKLLDANPRIGAQFRLFEDSEGIDVARALYIDLAGKSLHSWRRPTKDRTFVAEFHDLAAAASYFWKGELTFREWWPSLMGAKEFAWLCRDDLLPFAMMCIRLSLRITERVLRRRSGCSAPEGTPHYAREFRRSVDCSRGEDERVGTP